jgi:hypothetical protein
MVSGCIIQPHLKAYSKELCINKLAGEALIPPCDYQNITNKDQLKLITNSIPIMIYNALYYDDFPAGNRIVELTIKLEKNLQENNDNPWVRLLFTNYQKGLHLTKESLIKEAGKDPVLFEVSRSNFEQICSDILALINIEATSSREELFNWLKGHSI